MTRPDRDAARGETTPLLSNGGANGSASSDTARVSKSESIGWWHRAATPEVRLLLAGFMITTGLCFTQVPILFAFQKMACEDFYSHAAPYDGTGDRCSRPEIDATTTQQMAILGMSTIVCGILNLTITGMLIKKVGPKSALVQNTFFPILRVSMQAVAVGIGGRTGIIMMQCSQLCSIIGGPAGYLLTLNTSIAELVESSKRTAAFGRLQGASMFGTALGFLLGGIVGGMTNIRRPFEITACLLSICFVYCTLFIPYIDPKTMGGEDAKGAKAKKGQSLFRVLGPQTLRLKDGRIVKFYGLTLLALGGFVAGLAIGYAPVLTQLYSITALGFKPEANSAFMFMSFSIRGAFLMFMFPQIIKLGRQWLAKSKDTIQDGPALVETIPTEPCEIGPVEAMPEAEITEPANPPKPVDEDAGAAFDLFFLRWSMLGDVVVTGCIGFASKPWHIFLAGALLPFFSGSDAASKGVLTELVPASQRPDALQAITMVAYVSSLLTVGIFGSLFSAFAAVGKAYLTFFCNAGTAVFAIIILAFVKIPPMGSTVEADAEDPVLDTPTEEV